MKPDTSAVRALRTPLDLIERAHLADPTDASHTIARYEVGPKFTGLLQRFWVPTWSVPPGKEAPQRVLQYPVCLLVVTGDYARFYGVSSGLATTTLTGRGWAVGLMGAPAAGSLIGGRSMDAWTDRHVDLHEVLGDPGRRLVEQVRDAMAADPGSAVSHRVAMAAYEEALARYLPVDREGELINRVVAFVEQTPEVLRVAQVCAEFDLSERALQRLVRRRLGLTPRWLIQRRRLHEAAERLRPHGRRWPRWRRCWATPTRRTSAASSLG